MLRIFEKRVVEKRNQSQRFLFGQMESQPFPCILPWLHGRKAVYARPKLEWIKIGAL